jgi:hypothetical protein
MASILAGIERHRERLQQLKPRVLVGEFGGASGTLSSLETGAMETQAGLMKELGLGQPLISWHTVRDNFAEVGAFLGIRGRLAGQDRHGRQADDANRSGRGVRAVCTGARLVIHHAAKAQPDFVPVHPRQYFGGAASWPRH